LKTQPTISKDEQGIYGVLDQVIVVEIVDVLVYSKDEEEHEKHLHLVL
jgi:hypothetical protein